MKHNQIDLVDSAGDRYEYVLCYLHYGDDEERFSNDLNELDRIAQDMIRNNSAKPLIIVNYKDEIVKEYAERLRY